MLKKLKSRSKRGFKQEVIEERYGISLQEVQDEYQWLQNVADRHTSGSTRRMAQRLLDDFRKTLLGQISLELPL